MQQMLMATVLLRRLTLECEKQKRQETLQYDWMKVLTDRDLSQEILKNCGVLCLGRLRMTNKQIRNAVNRSERTRSIELPGSGYKHEHHRFSVQLDRELNAERKQRAEITD